MPLMGVLPQTPLRRLARTDPVEPGLWSGCPADTERTQQFMVTVDETVYAAVMVCEKRIVSVRAQRPVGTLQVVSAVHEQER